MNQQSKTEKKTLRVKLIISIAVLLFLLIFIFVFICIEQNKSDPASAAVIRKAAARQLNKDPNELTESDFAKITELCIAKKEIHTSYRGQYESHEIVVLSDLQFLKKFVNLEELDISYLEYSQKNIPHWMTYLGKMGIVDISKRTAFDLRPLKAPETFNM